MWWGQVLRGICGSLLLSSCAVSAWRSSWFTTRSFMAVKYFPISLQAQKWETPFPFLYKLRSIGKSFSKGIRGRKAIEKRNPMPGVPLGLGGSRSGVSGMEFCSSGPSHRMGMLDWGSLEHSRVQHRVLTTVSPFHSLNVGLIFLYLYVFLFFKVLSTSAQVQMPQTQCDWFPGLLLLFFGE